MPEPTHDQLERLILGYEALDAPDRERADAHLASCASCWELLAALQRAEQGARLTGSVPPLDDPRLAQLDPALRSEAEASLASLLVRAGGAGVADGRAEGAAQASPAGLAPPRAPRPAAGETASVRPGAGRSLRLPPRRRWAALFVPAAAAVIAVLLWPRPAQEPALLPGARLVPGTSYRSQPSDGLRTGDAFALEFELTRPAPVALVHLDPEGRVSLLIPGDAALSERFPAGRHRVPSDSAAVEWRLEGSGGRETFLLAASDRELPSGDALRAALERLPAAPRAERVRAARELLERRVGLVQVVEVEHRP